MADPRSAAVLSALRAAILPEQGRYLVAVSDSLEQSRLVTALASEGQVVLEPSTRFALDRLEVELFGLAVLDARDREALGPLSDLKEARPHTDLVLLVEPDPVRCAEVYAAEVEAVLPRPLPQADVLLNGHFRWLASCRRLRTNWLRLRQAMARLGPELARCERDLARTLSEASDPAGEEPGVLVLGAPGLAAAAGGRPAPSGADVVVLALSAGDAVPAVLQEAWSRSPEAALVVIDAAPTPDRLATVIYGGARAYLVHAHLPDLGRVVAAVAARRRAEMGGRRLMEALARQAPAANDVEAQAEQTASAESADRSSAPFVPSGHEVLLVDDEALALTVLREALRRGGYRVTTAGSGVEAMELLRRRSFDLVLAGTDLPGGAGMEVGRAARALAVPPALVLMTRQNAARGAAEAIGAYDYIENPLADLENLRTRVRRALSRHDQQQARVPPRAEERASRVLLVEAEGGRRQLMAEFLGRVHQVAAVADGAEAQRRLQQERFDVVVADRNLPGLSGLRVIEQGQRLLPHCACVLYTAYPSPQTVNEDLESLGQKVAEALRSRGGILLG
jgi:CheY-like chemotaxis protein